jgi:hypothetical protein
MHLSGATNHHPVFTLSSGNSITWGETNIKPDLEWGSSRKHIVRHYDTGIGFSDWQDYARDISNSHQTAGVASLLSLEFAEPSRAFCGRYTTIGMSDKDDIPTLVCVFGNFGRDESGIVLHSAWMIGLVAYAGKM